MALSDRILPLTDLLLGAAYADQELKNQERDCVRALLEELVGELSVDLELRLTAFDPKAFDLAAAATPFRGDSEDDRKRLLHLVTAVNESDEELDFSEDDYLRELCKALQLPESALAGLTVEMDLEQSFAQVRKGPPPPPKKK